MQKILFDENSAQKINKRIASEQIDEKVKKTLERKKTIWKKWTLKCMSSKKIKKLSPPL